jgi:hypothetical protein
MVARASPAAPPPHEDGGMRSAHLGVQRWAARRVAGKALRRILLDMLVVKASSDAVPGRLRNCNAMRAQGIDEPLRAPEGRVCDLDENED